jgi:hypothetical protein
LGNIKKQFSLAETFKIENYCENVPLMTFLIVFWSGNANMMEVLEARNSSEGVKQTSVFQASK